MKLDLDGIDSLGLVLTMIRHSMSGPTGTGQGQHTVQILTDQEDGRQDLIPMIEPIVGRLPIAALSLSPFGFRSGPIPTGMGRVDIPQGRLDGG